MGALKEKLRNSEEQAARLHAWNDLQWNCGKKEIKTLEKANAALRTDIARARAN